MAANYWDKFTFTRISRRHAMATTGAGALGAAFLAACGGGDDGSSDGGAKKDSSGLIAEPVDSTARAKAGGTLKSFAAADITTFDSLANNGSPPLSMSAIYAYPRLAKYKIAQYPKEYDGTFEGDLAESWEVSPDKLTLTFKIRQGVKWDSRAPTNGRLADAQDVLKSWEKFVAVNPGASTYAYNADTAPSSPVETLTAPDARTIVLKLKEPDSSIIPLFAGTTFSLMPREFDGGFDPRSTVRGHGPYMLDEYVPSSRFVWKRNPDYYVKNRPFIDRIEVPIIPEYATRLSQFKAGNIHMDVMGAFGGGQADIVPAKRDNADLLLAKSPFYPTQAAWGVYFGYDGVAPFKDQRMRQAASMLIDRDGYINVIDNRDGFAKDGLELDAALGTVVAAGWTGYWLNPMDEKAFGPAAKNFKYDVAEAKKLLSAAGYKGEEFDFHWNSSPTFPVQHKVVELFNAMFLDGGMKPKLNGINNPVQYQDDYYYGYQRKGYLAGTKKGYGGMAAGQERPFATIPLLVFGTLHKEGAFYKGISPDGRNVGEGDPKINDLAVKIKTEFDVQKQQALTHELIKYYSGQVYHIPQVSQAKGFSVWWPAIGNLNVHSSGTSPNTFTESRINWWIDETKAPFKKA